MAYALWELAKNPESQTKLRTELDDFVSIKGNPDFTVNELESMPYLNAVIKVCCPSPTIRAQPDYISQETLRIHTPVPDIVREASEDDILPLSKPIIGRSGKVHHEIFIPKGSLIHASASGYNMYVL